MHVAFLPLSILWTANLVTVGSCITLNQAWLGIPIFGSNFWDPHCKRNSNSVFDSKDSGRIFFFEILMSGESENWNLDLGYLEFR